MRCLTVLFAAALPAAVVVSPAAVDAQVPDATVESVEVLGSGRMDVPEVFESVPPKSRIIRHEFRVPADAGEGDDTARLTMMAAGGNVKANIDRWKGQFSGDDADNAKTEQMTVGDYTVHLVDISGTYADSMGGGPFSGGKKVQRPDYAMTAAIIVDDNDRKYFAKMVGPEGVVESHREAFVEMIKSLQ